MPSQSKSSGGLPKRWRVAALLLIALAIALAGGGTLLVVNQVRALTDRAVNQAAQWARQAASEAPLTPDTTARTFVPTEDFIQEQERTIITYTLVYVGLSVASLATLLLAMWMLLRLVRREMALAELKANFVADVSHELKTPLALIRLFAETLEAGRVPTEEKRQEYLSVILRESTRLTNLINNILDFARIEAGRKEYHLEPTDVARVLQETYETYRPQLEHEGFSHALSAASGLPHVDADPDAIAQIVVNLLNNAIKYSKEEKEVVIDLSADTRRGRRGVLISIHDRGIGIKPEDRVRLTEGFFRASDPHVRERGGTGLGLSLVKHIVEMHQGSLDIETRLVKGSTFRVFLPASAAEGSMNLRAGPGHGRPEAS